MKKSKGNLRMIGNGMKPLDVYINFLKKHITKEDAERILKCHKKGEDIRDDNEVMDFIGWLEEWYPKVFKLLGTEITFLWLDLIMEGILHGTKYGENGVLGRGIKERNER